mmetsp:Transcript_16805/g.22543  ORF Transcript_16805/g.22543 Transcript_16805/m.22543 type:complete len:124 (+) Transcript_16805:214-585(+)
MSVGKFVSAMYFVSIGLSWMISSSGDALDCFVDAAVRSLLFLRTESVVVVARDAAVEEEEGGVTAFEPPRKTWGKRLKVDLKCHLRSRSCARRWPVLLLSGDAHGGQLGGEGGWGGRVSKEER